MSRIFSVTKAYSPWDSTPSEHNFEPLPKLGKGIPPNLQCSLDLLSYKGMK